MCLQDVQCQWETEQKKVISMLEEPVCNTPVLNTIDFSDGAGQIAVGVHASLDRWGAISQQEDEKKDRHLCHYESGLWNKAE
jgi:hypothetical protein